MPYRLNPREEFWYLDSELLDVLDKPGIESAWIIMHFHKDENNCKEVVSLFAKPPPVETWRFN